MRSAWVIGFSVGWAAVAAAAAEPATDPSSWTIYITNDNCPDYTWGHTEERTRQAFADIVKGHLDEMKRTDEQPPENRDRYNAAVTQEVLCFVERYPERKEELIRRIKEGRLYVSPYLCNSLWAFQGLEGALRTMYPARRLEREWGIGPIDCAHHIELPSLPWGHATLLAGCGMKYLTLPYLGHDSTFGLLQCPPLFVHEGPDGSRVWVSLDRFASGKASYTQGANVLGRPDAVEKEWIAHYAKLGDAYPLRAILASGTHGDISPGSGGQARGFAEKIIQYNVRPGPHPKLFNATFPQFWQAVEQQQAKKAWLPTVRGDFGHSWDLWPVCLSKSVAEMREGERSMLSAEALLSVAAHGRSEIHLATLPDRQRAEWCWAMLSDHAWNGTGPDNQRHNADLRRGWAEELNRIAGKLMHQGWNALGVKPTREHVTVFNSLSFTRDGVVRIEAPENVGAVAVGEQEVDSQLVSEDGRKMIYFWAANVPAFGLKSFRLLPARRNAIEVAVLRAAPTQVDGPYYRLTLDAKTGGLASLVHKPTGKELVTPGKRTVCQTVYFDGQEHTLTEVKSEVVAQGDLLARLRVTGKVGDIEVTNFVTVYADLDQVDFDLRIRKPAETKPNRLCQVFPVVREGATLRVATTGAVIRPKPQPEGDLLPGADARRFAVQEFVDVSTDDLGVTIAPLDAFVLRTDLDPLTIESIGNDQNYKEVVKDQHGVTEFRVRYALQARAKGYHGPRAMAFARSAAAPLLAAPGRPGPQKGVVPSVEVDPARAVATCLKPADDGSADVILRLWEVAGKAGPLSIATSGYTKAAQTDLLERNGRELPIVQGKMTIDLRPHGLAAIRLVP